MGAYGSTHRGASSKTAVEVVCVNCCEGEISHECGREAVEVRD
jgi:hypothetical protein